MKSRVFLTAKVVLVGAVRLVVTTGPGDTLVGLRVTFADTVCPMLRDPACPKIRLLIPSGRSRPTRQ